ncbi:receptor-like protein 7 [Eucalyptus grandis]|uniref:receptor-like protein 7 n=1 Tax=Eucalyptus grandis TaxID=71139 RepID=UPI00192E8607|nr:receptor-like protein 7 [Eucalyptus grandis]
MARSSCFYMSINLLFLYLWSHPIGAHNLSRSVKPLCLENEISALLQFKERYDIANVSRGPLTRPKILSWNKGRDCCSWDGIECDENTGHVIILNLRSSFLYGSIDSNSTLFQLAHLEKLDLSDNHFNYSQIPSRIGDLLRLTYLNVSYSVFSGRVPSEIFKLTRLVYLDLCCNLDPYTSTRLLEMQPLGLRSLAQNLTSLEVLSLGVVAMSAKVPNTLANLSSLRALQMDVCDLHGVFPSAIFNLPKLIYLGVADNKALIGQLPYFNSSSPLKQLRVPGTSFSGKLPASIGSIPASFANLSNLEYLSVSMSPFTAQTISYLSWIWKIKKLASLYLQKINLYGEIPPSIGNLSQLVELSFLGNQLSGEILGAIGDLKGLQGLNLSNNLLTGQIPPLLGNLKALESLDLSLNKLSGQIPQKLTELGFLSVLNMSYNNLTGSVPRGKQFDTFSNNSFEGNSGLCGEFISTKCQDSRISRTTFNPPRRRPGIGN